MFNSPEFQALRREYVESVLERCAHLLTEATRLRSGDEVDLTKLRQEIHKFRGSGGFYGFAGLSQNSGTAEDHLLLVMDGEIPRDNRAIAALVEKVVEAAGAAAKDVGLR